MSAIVMPNRGFMQMCWVVPDLEAAVQHWLRSAGVGPFFLFDRVQFDDPCYRGHRGPCPPISAAMAQAGDVQIELVCQHDDSPSIWRDVVPQGQSGLHHMALYCDDYEASYDAYAKQHAVAFSGLMMGSRVCWMDTVDSLGFMVELIEANEIADGIFASFRAAAEQWDGDTPIRYLG